MSADEPLGSPQSEDLKEMAFPGLVAECGCSPSLRGSKDQIIALLDQVEQSEDADALIKGALIPIRKLIACLLGQIGSIRQLIADSLVPIAWREEGPDYDSDLICVLDLTPDKIIEFVRRSPNRPQVALLMIYVRLFELIRDDYLGDEGEGKVLVDLLKQEAGEIKICLSEEGTELGERRRVDRTRVAAGEEPMRMGTESDWGAPRRGSTGPLMAAMERQRGRTTAVRVSVDLKNLTQRGLAPMELFLTMRSYISMTFDRGCFNVALLAQCLSILGTECGGIARNSELQAFLRELLNQLPRRISQLGRREFDIILTELKRLRYDDAGYKDVLTHMRNKALELDESTPKSMDVNVLVLLAAESLRMNERDALESLYPKMKARLSGGESLSWKSANILLETICRGPAHPDNEFFLEKIVEVLPSCGEGDHFSEMIKLMIRLQQGGKSRLWVRMQEKLKTDILPQLSLPILSGFLWGFASIPYRCDELFSIFSREISRKFKTDEPTPECVATVMQSIAILGYTKGSNSTFLLETIQLVSRMIDRFDLPCLAKISWSAAIAGCENFIPRLFDRTNQLLEGETEEITGLTDPNCSQLYHVHLATGRLLKMESIFSRRRVRMEKSNAQDPSASEVEARRMIEEIVGEFPEWQLQTGVLDSGFELDCVLTRDDGDGKQTRLDVELDGPSHEVKVLVDQFRDGILVDKLGYRRVIRISYGEVSATDGRIDESMLKARIRQILAQESETKKRR